mmetsp:Transcript_11192/g.15697  ORF Transcript_11192/g.15697 Transcript_11192/m.15697 type:complete len:189 (+) Transcript_11192:106-672(+)
MSIAEFYIENGLDPSDPHHMDEFFGRYEMSSSDGESTGEDPPCNVEFSGFAIDASYEHVGFSGLAIGVVIDHVLEERGLDRLAREYNYEKMDTSSSDAPMASYKQGAVRLNFWLTTGTVGSYLKHPKRGKTQLFRRNVDMDEARVIFKNPRSHTGKGYHTKNGNGTKKSKGPCRYKKKCYRANCWFEH